MAPSYVTICKWFLKFRIYEYRRRRTKWKSKSGCYGKKKHENSLPSGNFKGTSRVLRKLYAKWVTVSQISEGYGKFTWNCFRIHRIFRIWPQRLFQPSDSRNENGTMEKHIYLTTAVFTSVHRIPRDVSVQITQQNSICCEVNTGHYYLMWSYLVLTYLLPGNIYWI